MYKCKFLLDALPDTGASKTLISWNTVKASKLNAEKSDIMKVLVANNTEMVSHGSVCIVLTPIEAIATEGMEQEMLICCTDLVKMKILHPNFPKEVCNSAQEDPLKGPMRALMNEFSDIFDNGDEVLKPLARPPMQIHLKKGPITPAKTLTARWIPIHQAKTANETIRLKQMKPCLVT